MKNIYGLLLVLFLSACGSDGSDSKDISDNNPSVEVVADVLKVVAKGQEWGYSFSVTLKSDDTGCSQYADWWEVLNEDGNLIYRRILWHPHTKTQPFERISIEPIKIKETDIVYIRAHMNLRGYSGAIFKGSVAEGFFEDKSPPKFSQEIEITEPLPSRCDREF